MTKQEFEKTARALKSAYRQADFLSTSESLATWYGFLRDYDYETIVIVVNNYIRTNTYPPAIADICNAVKAEEDKISDIKQQLREVYSFTKGVYPSADDTKNARVTWNKIIKQKDEWLDRLSIAKKLADDTARFVETAELEGRINEIPTFEDYLAEYGV